MKKKIIAFFSIASLIFLMAGVYIITSIEKTTSELDTLIKLHQVEILREHLLIQIKSVQSDLNLRGTRFARGIDAVVSDVTKMGAAVNVCFVCHHTAEVTERLSDLKAHIQRYEDSISRVLTIRANASRQDVEEDVAFKVGEDLIAKVNTMIALTNTKLMLQTQSALGDIARTKSIIFFLVVVGPLLAGWSALMFIRGLTRPVNMLFNATRKLKGGDLDYRVGPLKDEFGEVAQSFNEMAGALKEQMYRIEESEKRYRMLFERAGDGIFIIAANDEELFRIVAANRAAAEMHGYTADELLTMKLNDLAAFDSQENVRSLFERILGGEWVNVEMRNRRKDGEIFSVEISAGLLELGSNKNILVFERDITSRKQTEETLQRAEQLKVAGDLAAGLTHELKNSLAGIKVSVEVLLDELLLSQDDKRVLMNMIREIKRIELLMRDLLNFARPSKPQLAFVNINTVLDTSMTFSLKNVPRSSGNGTINVVKELDEHLPRTMADPMQLQQVFMNLLLNAVDAMADDGGALTVKTWYEPSDDSIQVSICDTGKGIDPEAIAKIFDPFFTTKPKGTGLGLAITKRLIEQHGGSIRVENLQKGTMFRIGLPVKRFAEVQVT